MYGGFREVRRCFRNHFKQYHIRTPLTHTESRKKRKCCKILTATRNEISMKSLMGAKPFCMFNAKCNPCLHYFILSKSCIELLR